MAFMRKQSVVEAVDVNTLTPDDTEKRITAGVKKYATNEANYAAADANTPYLGHIVGMGIESSNLADITMSIERQFLTKMTTKTQSPSGSASEYTLTAGELGKLRILDGQDALAATPGLSVKMLMDLGHMPKNDAYLEKVMSSAYVMATGDGWKMSDALKMAGKAEKLAGAERGEALVNLKTLVRRPRTMTPARRRLQAGRVQVEGVHERQGRLRRADQRAEPDARQDQGRLRGRRRRSACQAPRRGSRDPDAS